MFNDDMSGYDPQAWMNFEAHVADATGLYTMSQIGQNCRANRLQYYDYGPERNLGIYGSEEVPEIALENLDIPIALFSSLNDGYSPIEGQDWFAEQ